MAGFQGFEMFFWCVIILGQQSEGAGGWIGGEGGKGGRGLSFLN